VCRVMRDSPLAPRFSALDPLSVFDSKVIWGEGFDRRTADPRRRTAKVASRASWSTRLTGSCIRLRLRRTRTRLRSSPIKVAC